MQAGRIRIAAVAALFTFVLASPAPAPAADAPAKRPNILFIISDDLSPTALGVEGNTQCKTPSIDKLAARGVRFTHAYCQYPVCAASRAALMASWYPQQTGVIGNARPERFTQTLGDRPSMTQHFKNHGYLAARLGKIYHMGVPGNITEGSDGPDHAASWSEAHNFKSPEQHSTGPAEMLSNDRVTPDPNRHFGQFGTAMYVVQTDTDGSEQHDPRAADKAIQIMTAHKDSPFFLAVGFVRPHVPLVAPRSYFQPYPPHDIKLAEVVPGDLDDIPPAGIPKFTEKSRGMTDENARRKALAAYYASVSFMDAQVGRLLDALDKLDLADNTIVVFCSDHGWHLGEHTFWQKNSLHEESARIPLIIAAPGKRPGVRDALVEQIDLYPTLAALAGLDVPPHCMGKSLVPVLDDPAARVRDFAYCLLGTNGHLVRTDRWAFMHYGNDAMELYDLRTDPRQYTNLAHDPAHAATVADLKAKLAAKLSEITPSKPGITPQR